MKNIYVPSIEELERLKQILENTNITSFKNSYNCDLFSYCLAKKIEIILAHGGLEYFGPEEKNDYYLVRRIIKFFPTDIWCTPYNDDPIIANEMITNNKTNYYFGLDNIQLLSKELQNDNNFVIKVIHTLLDDLNINPYYRFEYADSDIINNIFSKKIIKTLVDKNNIMNRNDIVPLIEIEPSYILDIDKRNFEDCLRYKNNEKDMNREQGNALAYAIHKYASRYGVNFEYMYPNEEKKEKCKKLVLFLQEHNK